MAETYHKRGKLVDGYRVRKHPLYAVWASMKSRCSNEKESSYKNYGGRGIIYCDEWKHFENFVRDMGPKPFPGATLERKDNDGNYSPDNCVWATVQQQMKNRRVFKNSTTGVTGIIPLRRNGFNARYDDNGVRYDLGNFDMIEQAKAARDKFAKLHETCDRRAIDLLNAGRVTPKERRLRRDSSTGIKGVTRHQDGGFLVRKTIDGTRDIPRLCPILGGSGSHAARPSVNTDEIRARISKLKVERERWKVKADGLKTGLNGPFGKLGSPHSYLYSPEMLLATTLTGQLSILMLIERTEAAGIPVVSANTDGIVVRCPRPLESAFEDIVAEWEKSTGFAAETTRYLALYNSSVNSYLAIKPNGSVKLKGPISNPWAEGDFRGQMSKNPQMTILSDAIVAFVRDKTSIVDSVRACRDPRAFVTVIKVTGGAVWRGHPLGRVARFYWSTDGDPITYADGRRKVAKTDGAKPMIELTKELPPDLDLARYVAEAERLAADLGVEPYASRVKEGGLLS